MTTMPSTTTECMEEEAYTKQLSTLSITNKSSMPMMGADQQPAVAVEKESAATEKSGEKIEETWNCQNTNAASKEKKNKNAVLIKTSDLKNNSKSSGTGCVQDGRNEETEHIDHRDSVVRDDETTVKQIEDIVMQTSPTGPIAITKTSLSNTESVMAQREMKKNLDTQISTLSVDGGEQDANSVVFQGSQCQGHRLDPVPQMCELAEPTVDTGFCSSQESLDYSRFQTPRNEPVLTRGGDGGFNVFSGGRATVGQLKLNLSASDLEPDVWSLSSRDRNQAPTSVGGNINVFPGGNLQVGSIQGVPGPSVDSCFEGDAVILNAEEDNELACEFKRHLEQDIGCDNVKAYLFGLIDQNMSQNASLETLLERFRYVFVLVTRYLKNDPVINLTENLDADAASGRSWKKDRIIPVWMSHDKSLCPMVLKRLQGLTYYNREKAGKLGEMYLDSLKNQMEAVRKKSPDWEKQMKEDGK